MIFERGTLHFYFALGSTDPQLALPSGSQGLGQMPSPPFLSASGLPVLSHQVKGHTVRCLLHQTPPRWWGQNSSSLCLFTKPSTGQPRSRHRGVRAGWHELGQDDMNWPLLGVLGGVVGPLSNSAFYLEILQCPSGHILTRPGLLALMQPLRMCPVRGAGVQRSVPRTLSSTCVE